MKRILLSTLLLVTSSLVFSQSAADMEQLLASNSVTYEQAAWFILQAADIPISRPQAAFSHAAENNWLPAGAKPDNEAALDSVSLLIMQAFDLKGGIFYSEFKNPRYAYRELLYKSIIQGRVDPGMAVSGEYLLYLLGRVTQ